MHGSISNTSNKNLLNGASGRVAMRRRGQLEVDEIRKLTKGVYYSGSKNATSVGDEVTVPGEQ